MRVQFDAVSAPAGLLGREQSRAASCKGIQNNAASFRAVKNSVADEGERFRRRVSGERRFPVLPETAHASVFPDVRSAPAKSSQFNIVDVFGAAVLVDENELVGGAI